MNGRVECEINESLTGGVMSDPIPDSWFNETSQRISGNFDAKISFVFVAGF